MVLICNSVYRMVAPLALSLSDGPAGAARLVWSHCRGVQRNRLLTSTPLICNIHLPS